MNFPVHLFFFSIVGILNSHAQKKQEILPGCKFCILNVPCKCTLTTKELYYSPKLIDFHKSLNLNNSIAHPVNLALLHEFFDDWNLHSILGDTTFAESVKVNLPILNYMLTITINFWLMKTKLISTYLNGNIKLQRKMNLFFSH